MTAIAHCIACYCPTLTRQRVGGLTFLRLGIAGRVFVASYCESRKGRLLEV
jgi:hypothetical protein